MRSRNHIVFYGDPHGDYRGLRGLLASPPRHLVFLGDMDLERPFDEELAELKQAGTDIHYIHGNHDTDRVTYHDNLFHSDLGRNNLHAKVIDLGGVRVAGLGGVFKEKIWHPRNGEGEPNYRTRREFTERNPHVKWRGGLPLNHRSAIFPEDIDKLADLRADVLVTHEAPSCHRYGFEDIDLVAQFMGVRTIIHGHHHENAESILPSGIRVIGLGKAEIRKCAFDADTGEFLAQNSEIVGG